MNYAATYCALISKRLRNPIKKCGDGTVETHHIIPKSEGGLDEKDNLVNLTAREHYIAHLLLAKIYDDYKMWGAVQTMTVSNGLQSRRITYNSRLYEHARKMYLKRRKARPAPRGWKQTPESIRKRVESRRGFRCSEESKEKQRKAMKGRTQTKEQIEKARQTRFGRKWWNNGTESRFQKDRPSGEGWVEGRLAIHIRGLYEANLERQKRV